MVNQHAVMRRIIWSIITIWLGIDATVAVEAAAQSQHNIVEKPDEHLEEGNTDSTPRVADYVLEVARYVSSQAQNFMVDLVFLVDGSRSMMDKILAIEEILPDVAEIFDEEFIDCRFSLQRLDGVPKARVQPFASDLVGQVWFRKLRLRPGNSAPGYGLDIILQTLRRTNFRPDASKHILVVTHSNLRTAWTAKDAKDKIVKQIVDLCKRDDIRINAIGVRESAQIKLTTATSGKFFSIAGSNRSGVRFHSTRDLDKSILKTEGIFKLTAQHIAATALQPADIIFMLDSSLSMETKVEEICRGIDELVNVLDAAKVDYRFGVVRFWAASGGGQSIVLVTKPPLNTNQIKRLFQMPKQGDEHLLDAVIEGVPKLETPTNRKLVLVIVTDEPTSHRAEKGYTVDQAIGVCRMVEAQVNVIGASSMRSSKTRSDTVYVDPSTDFSERVSKSTNGVYYVIPGSFAADKGR